MGKRKVLKPEEIAKYGAHIIDVHAFNFYCTKIYNHFLIQAILFLYAHGFPPLGHIHTGNIFITDRGCTLAGYDNTLLGYRSNFHRLFGKNLDQHLLESIDVIMFGM